MWKVVKAKDYCKGVTDGTHDSPKNTDTGKYLITSKHLTEYKIDFSSAKLISTEDYEKIVRRSKIEQFDILFSMIGTIGNIYLEKNKYTDYACKNMGIFQMGGNIEKAYWLYYYLKSPQAKAYINSHLRGSTQQYLPLGALRDFSIPVPDDLTQKRIVSILKCIDDAIENNNKINRNLYNQLQLLFKEQYLNNSNYNNWKTTTIGNVTSKFATGLNPRKNFVLGKGNNYYVTIKNMANNRIYLDDKCDKVDNEALIKINARSDLKKGDVLFSGIATIGRVHLIDDNAENWNISESVFTMRPNKDVSSEFLFLLLLSKNVQEYTNSLASGSAQRGIRKADFVKYELKIPPKETMKSLTDNWKSLIEMIKCNEKENDKLAVLRDILLTKLMSGELDITDLDV